MSTTAPVAAPVASEAGPRTAVALLVPALAGAAVAVALGIYGRVHDATGEPIFDLGFPSVLAMKAWLTTLVFALAGLQLLSALRMYGKLRWPRTMPRWLPAAHRWSGTAAFVVSLPVAYHCLWSLGLRTDAGWRPLLHGILGCAFYGAFTIKMLALRSDRVPRWALPVLGGTLVGLLTGLWLTSSLWFFTTVDFPAFR